MSGVCVTKAEVFPGTGEDPHMFATNELVLRLEEIQLIIIKGAEVVGVILVCVLGLRPHYKKLRGTHQRKKRTSERSK